MAGSRRRVWPWIIAMVAVGGLLAGAVVVAEAVSRDLVVSGIRDRVVSSLDLPADQPVDVQVEGLVLPQLVAGRLDDVTISSEDVVVDVFAGDVTVQARGIPLRGEAPLEAAEGTVRMDVEQVRGLLAAVEDFPVDSLAFDAPDVTMTVELSVFGAAVPVGVALTPSAVDGDLVLTPSALQIAGAEVGADELRARFGGLADSVARDWPVCIAQYLPAGLTLADVAIDGDTLVADVDVDGAIAVDPALLENGTCE
ncbi:LmeA family phospholipid-binding protein [Microbacterium sp. ARD31]|uniref:LmeA family phospholipid-binding protein n=1 Tax=Microbacterium sp. ARD31 TaxID=2962576 RepID=UPI0028824376|nr:LmeA family phospholipid-binding protein [Microbacterium sp. ARD31]MDT0183225.1 LmeA family phospholipid-binding protein [Microbacterium sp. ARD31]